MSLLSWIFITGLLVGGHFAHTFISKYGPFSPGRYTSYNIIVAVLAFGVGYLVEGYLGCFANNWGGMCGLVTLFIAAGISILWLLILLVWTTVRFLKLRK
ncbi:MAG: hypothetical protein Q7R65_02180 [bacterium]|nr:hypothetical protein [bacterium]